MDLQFIKKEINKVNPKFIIAYDSNDYPPVDDTDTLDVNHLLVTDNPQLQNDEDLLMWGAWIISIKNNKLYAVWGCYPEEPIIGLNNFITHLKNY